MFYRSNLLCVYTNHIWLILDWTSFLPDTSAPWTQTPVPLLTSMELVTLSSSDHVKVTSKMSSSSRSTIAMSLTMCCLDLCPWMVLTQPSSMILRNNFVLIFTGHFIKGTIILQSNWKKIKDPWSICNVKWMFFKHVFWHTVLYQKYLKMIPWTLNS